MVSHFSSCIFSKLFWYSSHSAYVKPLSLLHLFLFFFYPRCNHDGNEIYWMKALWSLTILFLETCQDICRLENYTEFSLLVPFSSYLKGGVSSVVTWLNCISKHTNHSYNNRYAVKNRQSSVTKKGSNLHCVWDSLTFSGIYSNYDYIITHINIKKHNPPLPFRRALWLVKR